MSWIQIWYLIEQEYNIFDFRILILNMNTMTRTWSRESNTFWVGLNESGVMIYEKLITLPIAIPCISAGGWTFPGLFWEYHRTVWGFIVK